MKRIITLIAAACVCASLTAGCDFIDRIKSDFSNEPAEPIGVERVEKNEVSNNISVGIIDFDTFNPLMTKSQTVRECMQFVYEPLFDVDEGYNPRPKLADSYSVSPDGKTIDINLRTDVLWQDGSVFNANDVVYTLRQIKSGVTGYTDVLSDMSGCQATGDHSVKLSLNYAIPSFVSLMTFPIVQNRTDMKSDPNYIPMGTGTFKYDSQMSTGKLSFSAFEQYHGGRAQIDNLYVYIIPDLARYESMFEASEIDLMTGETVDLSEYTPRGSAKSNEYLTNKMTYLGYNMQNQLLTGKETRKGLAKLIDKDSIVNSTIYSRGVQVDIPINPASVFYYDTNTKFKTDEVLALSLLGNDDWGVDAGGDYIRTVNGKKQTLAFTILANADSAEQTAIAEKIAADLSKFGIHTTVDAQAGDKYLSKLNSKDYALMIGEINLGPNLDLTPLVSSAGNYFSYANPDVDTIIGQIGMTGDESQLIELYKQYGAILTEDMPFSPLFFRKGSVLSGTKIKTEIKPSVTSQFRNTETWSVRE